MTLNEILEREKSHRTENGMFGIKACKESILNFKEFKNASLYQLLEEYVKRANEDVFFNKAMVLACWELINEPSTNS